MAHSISKEKAIQLVKDGMACCCREGYSRKWTSSWYLCMTDTKDNPLHESYRKQDVFHREKALKFIENLPKDDYIEIYTAKVGANKSVVIRLSISYEESEKFWQSLK